MIFDNICNLREDNDKTQKELADYLVGRTKKIMNGKSSPIKSVKNSPYQILLNCNHSDMAIIIYIGLYARILSCNGFSIF